MHPIEACYPTRIENRVSRIPMRHKTVLRTFCLEHALRYPVTTDNPVIFEILPTSERHGYGVDGQTHLRNFPDLTYTLFFDDPDPKTVIEILAYYAHEWEAQEIARAIHD